MEQNEQERALEVVVEATPTLIRLTPEAIEVTKHNIASCEHLVSEVLERDIDWGLIPGVPQPNLWDPGAAKIMAAFNCYPKYTILNRTEEDNLISFTFECALINRQSQQPVASGIGACSTRETKYKYRWVFEEEAITLGLNPATLKHRDKKYQVPNPERGELVNTIAKMAAKRADVDATQSLPGVAATLRKLFKGIPVKAERHKVSPPKTEEHAPEKPEQQAKRKRPIEGGWAEPETFNDLYKICFDLYKLQPVDVLRELGVSSQMDLTITPVEALQTIKAVYKDIEGTNLFEGDAEQIP